ncbi:MAG TPA: GNAT family N-acetyltransferase [Stellaceae bacterium]|nr:GNAT family N-acetyltransferase [Stellaceae bacterium]
MTITIERIDSPTPEARQLVAELNDALAALYSEDQRHGLRLERLFQPSIRFFIVRADGVAAGCGGIEIGDGVAEVKRMFTRPALRRRGVARALLRHLEVEARDAGATTLRLETGVHQPGAIALYLRAGFIRCAPFGRYAEMRAPTIALSLFLQKPL